MVLGIPGLLAGFLIALAGNTIPNSSGSDAESRVDESRFVHTGRLRRRRPYIVAGDVSDSASKSRQNDDDAVPAVATEYVDAINADDLSRLLNISVGTAELELETIDIPRNANDVGRWTEPHAKKLRVFKNSYGDVEITEFEIIARGDRRVVARVHTRFARQPE